MRFLNWIFLGFYSSLLINNMCADKYYLNEEPKFKKKDADLPLNHYIIVNFRCFFNFVYTTHALYVAPN